MNSNAENQSLSDVAEVFFSCALRMSVDALADGQIRMIQLKNVSADHGVDWNEVAKIEVPTKKEPRWLRDGDILFAGRSTNNFAVILQSPPSKTLCAPHFFVIRVTKVSVILPRFLSWQINQLVAQAYFAKSAVGTTVANIRKEVVENLRLVIPPLETQVLIIKMSEAALAEKKILTKLIENRDRQMQAIAASLITTKEQYHG